MRGQQVWLREGSIVSVDALGESDGGTLTVTAQNLWLQDGSQLQTGTRGPGGVRAVAGLVGVNEAGSGAAGNLQIEDDRLELRNGAALVGDTCAGAGNLQIATGLLRENSRISTNTL